MKAEVFNFFRLTFLKIVLAVILVFASPTFFKICYNDGSCGYRLNFLSGWMLWRQKAPGLLTFPMMLLLFLNSYLLSCLITFLYKKFRERKKGF